LGVLLFFLISGFVIMMTLERSYGILDFSVRRIARLWPAMLVCATLSTIIINSSDIASYYSGAEEWAVHPLEYFSSIFFVSPDVVSTLFGHADAQWVEGVYWTLWAEVRFYILIALIFLVSPRSWFFWLWAVTQAVSTGFQLATLVDPDIVESVSALFIVFQPRFLCWFSLGLCGYMFWTRRLSAAVTAIAALAAVAVLASAVAAMGDDRPAAAPDGWSLLAVYCLVFGTFALFLIGSPLLRPLRWRPLLAVGLASYPLYLFHERVGMAGLKYTSEIGLAPWLGVLLVVTAVVVAALIIHKIVEVPAKRALTRVGEPMVRKLEKEYRCLRFSQTAQPTRRPA